MVKIIEVEAVTSVTVKIIEIKTVASATVEASEAEAVALWGGETVEIESSVASPVVGRHHVKVGIALCF